MSGPRRLFRWPWRTAAQVRDDVDAELRFHLDARARDLERDGLSTTGAARRARAEFGDVEATRARLGSEGARFERRARRAAWLGELLQDVRFGWRALRRRPGFLAVAVLTLALGVGANTAIFGVVDAVLLRPLPYPEPERLVAVWPTHWFSAGEYVGFRDRTRSFAGLAAYRGGVGLGLSGEGEPERLDGALVSATFFATLGADAALGRTFAAGEDAPGGDAVVVLGDGLWRRRFGADPGILGRTIRLDGQPRTVVGVMPAGFHFPGGATQLWVPMHIDPASPGDLWGYGGNVIIGRLAPGVTPAQAAADVLGVAGQLRRENPLWTPDSAAYLAGAEAVPLRERMVGDVRRMLLTLLGAAALVLLIACANVANLLLARGLERERELAVRSALGAGRGRLARQLLTESALLALAGGVAGTAVAIAGLRLLVTLLPADTPRLAEVTMDPRVLGAALAASLAAGVLFGIMPALRLTRPDVRGALRTRGTPGAARRRLLSTLVVGEMALAVVLVTGAGLLLKSLWRLGQVDPGFRTAHALSARLSPPESRFHEAARRLRFHEAVLDRVHALPGVTAAAVTSQLPFDQELASGPVAIPGVTLDPNNLPLFEQRRVSPEYFRALGVRVVRGRGFTDADREGARLVALVDEHAARQFWPGEDPIGKTVGFPWFERWMTVVGVVSPVRNNDLRTDADPALYIPFAQDPQAAAVLVVRTTGEPAVAARRLRALVAAVDADVPVSHVRTLDDLLAASLAQPRLATALLGTFAGLALLLGAVGLYGMIAYQVSQRTREIGVRVALGARGGEVLGLVLRQGMKLALIGTAAGLAGALVLTRVLRGLLYDVSATDPWTFAAVPLVLTAVAVLATVVPARRAARVSPVTAMRAE